MHPKSQSWMLFTVGLSFDIAIIVAGTLSLALVPLEKHHWMIPIQESILDIAPDMITNWIIDNGFDGEFGWYLLLVGIIGTGTTIHQAILKRRMGIALDASKKAPPPTVV